MTTATDPTDSPTGSTRPAGPRRRRRRWLVVLIALVVCLAVLALLDRIALVVAEHKLAARIQTSQQLSSRPHVSIEGFPFLFQTVQGRYRHVDITATSPITQDGVTVSRAHAQLNNVRVRTGDVLRGTVRDVPVSSGTGTALITYAGLTALVHRYGGAVGSTVTVSPGTDGRAKLTGPLGLSIDVAGAIVGRGVRITPDAAELAALPSFLSSGITQALATPIPLPALPFGVTLTSGAFEPAGLDLHATAHNSTFPVR